MKLTNTAARYQSLEKLAFYAGLSALLLLSQGCQREMKNVAQYGSHQITVARHATTNEALIIEQNGETTYHYSGYRFPIGRFDVVIKDEDVIVNGKVYGRLNTGDSVFINDKGVTVNAMSDGETAKYLQTNSEQARP